MLLAVRISGSKLRSCSLGGAGGAARGGAGGLGTWLTAGAGGWMTGGCTTGGAIGAAGGRATLKG
ncbi:hypothetical protein ES703_110443 [subsurface metagenome]